MIQVLRVWMGGSDDVKVGVFLFNLQNNDNNKTNSLEAQPDDNNEPS